MVNLYTSAHIPAEAGVYIYTCFFYINSIFQKWKQRSYAPFLIAESVQYPLVCTYSFADVVGGV